MFERIVKDSLHPEFIKDYLLSLHRRVMAESSLPIIVNCTDIGFIKKHIPELSVMENDGRIKLQQIGGHQEKLI